MAQIVAALLLWRERVRRYVLLCCGLTVLLGIAVIRLVTPNLWSDLTVLGGLVAGCVVWMVPFHTRGPSPAPR
jgi:hypothetical protein